MQEVNREAGRVGSLTNKPADNDTPLLSTRKRESKKLFIWVFKIYPSSCLYVPWQRALPWEFHCAVSITRRPNEQKPSSWGPAKCLLGYRWLSSHQPERPTRVHPTRSADTRVTKWVTRCHNWRGKHESSKFSWVTVYTMPLMSKDPRSLVLASTKSPCSLPPGPLSPHWVHWIYYCEDLEQQNRGHAGCVHSDQVPRSHPEAAQTQVQTPAL